MIDVTKKMNSKERRIWRRREQKRAGHSIRCRLKYGKSCNCQAKKLREHGIREKADKFA